MTDRSLINDAAAHARRTNPQADTDRLADLAISRLRTYVGMSTNYVLGEILYDERFRSDDWPRTAYHPCRPDLEQLLARLDELTAERDQYAARVPLVCSDERHAAKVRGLETRIEKAETDRDFARRSADNRGRAIDEQQLHLRESEETVDRWRKRAKQAETALAEYEHVRASITAGEPLGRALTVSEVLEQHEVTRKALIHELGEGLHLNWRQVITATGRMRRAAFDWLKDFEQAKAERDAALAAVARVREYCDLTADSCRVQARQVSEDVTRLLNGTDMVDVLIARSSLGSPEVQAIAALTPPEDVAEIMRRVRESDGASDA